MSFSPLHKIKEQKDGTGPAGGGEKEKWYQWEEEGKLWEGEYNANTVHTRYINGKMIPVQTIPGMGGGSKRRMMKEVNYSSMYDVL
jgi:hypothetical protein